MQSCTSRSSRKMLNHPNYSWSSRLAARCFETSLPPDLPSLTTVSRAAGLSRLVAGSDKAQACEAFTTSDKLHHTSTGVKTTRLEMGCRFFFRRLGQSRMMLLAVALAAMHIPGQLVPSGFFGIRNMHRWATVAIPSVSTPLLQLLLATRLFRRSR